MSSPVQQQLRSSFVEISRLFHPQWKKQWVSGGISRLRTRQCQRCNYQESLKGRSFHDTRLLAQQIQAVSHASKTLDRYKNSLGFLKRTHEIVQLPKSYVQDPSANKVVLHGFLGARRDVSKKLSFAILRDPYADASVQIVSSFHDSARGDYGAHETLKGLRAHTPVVIRGFLQAKPEGDRRAGVSVGEHPPLSDFEVVLQDVQSLNVLPDDTVITSQTEFPSEQRHLQLQFDKHLASALELRSNIKSKFITELTNKYGFTEVETPLLFKSTSEGAREFIVPTRRKGLAYALPQSPQQLKQILMASGIRNYFQFAKCFRDEDLRADRQPEFTQFDLEMAFASSEDIVDKIQDMVSMLWRDFLQVELSLPFPRLTYDQAMSEYGSDKPDLRIPIPPFTRIEMMLPADLVNMISSLKNPIVEAMVLAIDAPPAEVRRAISTFLDSKENQKYLANPSGAPGIFVYDSSKPLHGLSAFGFEAVERLEENLDLEDGNLIILQARERAPLTGGSTPLGELRTALFKLASGNGFWKPLSWSEYRPLWVTDFPLFSPPNSSEPGQGGKAGLASTHHPFTSPKTSDDVDALLVDPTTAIGDHYDLVINGEEIGGGSRRIHHADMQEFIFRDILKMDDTRIAEFSHLLAALRSGCPPHAGIALGFDRLVAMLHSGRTERKTSLRDVIAFPKSGSGEDLMVKSPGSMSEETLETYHLKLRE